LRLNVGIKDFERGTTIDEIEVPEEMRSRLLTGLPYFDEALSGTRLPSGTGAMPSTVGLFTGVPGGGKTTLMLQLAHSIASIHGPESVLYNTAEESLYQTKMTAERLELTGFTVGQDIEVTELLEHADELGARFLLVDSLQTLWDPVAVARKGPNTVTPVRCLEAMTDWAKENFNFVLAVGHVNKSGHFAGKNVLAHTVDLRLHLDIRKDPEDELFGCRNLHVEKNRFGPSGHEFILEMGEDGLEERRRGWTGPGAQLITPVARGDDEDYDVDDSFEDLHGPAALIGKYSLGIPGV